VTEIDATGTGVTVTVADAVAAPDVAVIVAVPGATPLTTPFASTVATAAELVPHVTVRPVNTLPDASLVTAVKVTFCPATTVAVDAFSVMLATAAVVTVMVAAADLPSLVAVIVAVPAFLPVTSPALLTEAIVESLVVHVTVCPLSAFPWASRGVALRVSVAPTATDAFVASSVTEESDAAPPPPPLGGPATSLPPPHATAAATAAMTSATLACLKMGRQKERFRKVGATRIGLGVKV
jgi:hypothetical protein